MRKRDIVLKISQDNPKTGEVVPVPERQIVVFKPGLDMKKYVK